MILDREAPLNIYPFDPDFNSKLTDSKTFISGYPIEQKERKFFEKLRLGEFDTLKEMVLFPHFATEEQKAAIKAKFESDVDELIVKCKESPDFCQSYGIEKFSPFRNEVGKKLLEQAEPLKKKAQSGGVDFNILTGTSPQEKEFYAEKAGRMFQLVSKTPVEISGFVAGYILIQQGPDINDPAYLQTKKKLLGYLNPKKQELKDVDWKGSEIVVSDGIGIEAEREILPFEPEKESPPDIAAPDFAEKNKDGLTERQIQIRDELVEKWDTFDKNFKK